MVVQQRGVTSDAQQNTVGGTNAGDSFSGTSAIQNTLYGFDAGTAITSADGNIAIGYEALEAATTGSYNVAIRRLALDSCNSDIMQRLEIREGMVLLVVSKILFWVREQEKI